MNCCKGQGASGSRFKASGDGEGADADIGNWNVSD
jgi:hypothetical protein